MARTTTAQHPPRSPYTPLLAQPNGFDRRPRSRMLLSVAAVCGAMGLIVAATNNYMVEEGFQKPAPPAMRASTSTLRLASNENPIVELTPEVVSAILNMPEKQQMALVMPASTKLQEQQKRAIIATAVQKSPVMAMHEEHEEEDDDHHGLEDHEGEEHELTPAQERAERMWALIFVTAIVTVSVLFETMKEIIEDYTPPAMIKVVQKFFGELATLGFIGTIAFVLTTGFAGHESVLGHVSFWYTGDGHLLIHEFEILHFLIFFVMVFFISAVLVILQIAVNQKRIWTEFETKLNNVFKANLGVRETKRRQLLLMHIPEEVLKVEGTLTAEYTKPKRVHEAEFMRFRQRFMDDTECDVDIPDDFDFADYMTRCISHILSEVVEIGVYDWVALWTVFLLLFIINALVQLCYPNFKEGEMPVYIICFAFGLLQICLLVAAVMGFRSLAYMKSMLLPRLEKAEFDRVTSADTDEKVDMVTVVNAPRYDAEMKLLSKDDSWFHKFMSLFKKVRAPSKHEQLFGAFGADGPSFFLHFIKLILLGAVVSIASLTVILFGPLFELSFILPFVAVIPAAICILLTPRMVVLYSWCTSVEMLKHPNLVIEVIREQKQAKLIDILRILTMLSFFLDQVEFVKSMATEGGGTTEQEKSAITDGQWKQLIAENDPKVVEDLEALFNEYDEDDSGELEKDEVKALVEQLGTKLSDDEADNLFRIMDADGSGSVDFKEFAMVILHQKAAKSGKLNFSKIAEKMFKIFDKSGTGIVRAEDLLLQMEKLGSNWDRDGIQFFFNQIDTDGSGEISQAEFVAYIHKIEAEVRG